MKTKKSQSKSKKELQESIKQEIEKQGNWNISNVKNMEEMFPETKFKFNGDINKWDVSNVKNMESMFLDIQKLIEIFLNKKFQIFKIK